MAGAGVSEGERASGSTGPPQAVQNRSPSGTAALHDGQLVATRAPHEPQKRDDSGLSKPQAVQCMGSGSLPKADQVSLSSVIETSPVDPSTVAFARMIR